MIACSSHDGHMTEYSALILCDVGMHCVLAMTWDVTRDAHGAGSGEVQTNQHSLGSTEGEY